MSRFNSLIDQIKTVDSANFDSVALQVFKHQYEYNEIYQKWCNSLGRTPESVSGIQDIPFLPIEFFKTHKIKTGDWTEEQVFTSSGTTGLNSSQHFVKDTNSYLNNCRKIFESNYGPLSDYIILALLPSYLERNGSGLISMVDDFIIKTGSEESGFYLNEFHELSNRLEALKISNKKVILWGVTFALLDFASNYKFDFPQLIIMETGGMKGRREEMVRSEVHELLKESFGVSNIHSEYGMTELFSQAYSDGEGVFTPGRTMKVIGRDINDPLTLSSSKSTVGLNIIDLANINTCSFIETKDLGSVHNEVRFEVKGRIDNTDIRGCNLLVI